MEFCFIFISSLTNVTYISQTSRPRSCERKAQLDDYAQRRGQEPAAALDDVWPMHSNGRGKIIRKRSKASGRDMQSSRLAKRVEEAFEELREKHGLPR